MRTFLKAFAETIALCVCVFAFVLPVASLMADFGTGPYGDCTTYSLCKDAFDCSNAPSNACEPDFNLDCECADDPNVPDDCACIDE